MKKYFLISILSLAASAVMVFLLIFPSYDRIVISMANIVEKEKIIADLNDLIQKTDKWRGQIGDREASMNKLNLALPSEKAIPDFFVSLSSLIGSAGIVLEDVKIRVDEKISVLGDTSSIKAFDATLSIRGTYSALKVLLSGLEENIRVADIQSINFDSTKDSDGSVLDFIINLKVYYNK
ncbi:MAG: type 4a pilus biogenesis protein PilO [Patescibacteria group bacterium]